MDASSRPDDAGRAWLGLLLAPTLAALLLLVPADPGFTPLMRMTAALAAVMACLWLSEAVPLAATALLPLLALPAMGLAKAEAVAAAYAGDLAFLFVGGFVLANGLEAWGLHHRLADGVLAVAGRSPRAIVGALMAATAFVSLWISNTAAALLMMPVALAVGRAAGPEAARFRGALALGVALAASIGGMGTPIGSTPNLLVVNTARRLYGLEVDFGRWMAFGVPLVALFTLVAWAIVVGGKRPLGPARIEPPPRERAPLARGEVQVAAVFACTVLAWVFREPKALGPLHVGLTPLLPWLTDGGIAVAGALALFLLPCGLRPLRFPLDWARGGKLPWDVVLLLGGGLALADGLRASGLDGWLVGRFAGLTALPLWAIVLLLGAAVVALSEVASNTATAALCMPIAGALAERLDAPPLMIMLPVALAASLGYMMPAATPPNALAIGTGEVSPRRLAMVGFWLNLVGLGLVMAACFGVAFPLLGLAKR